MVMDDIRSYEVESEDAIEAAGGCVVGAARRRGPCSPSNTGASKLHMTRADASQRGLTYDVEIPEPQDQRYHRTGGVDWFEAMVYLQWDHLSFKELAQTLDAAAEASGGLKPQLRGFCQLPGSRGQWRVEPIGCALGPNLRCRWRFERDGVEFGLVNRPDAHQTRVSGYVRIRGESLIAMGDVEDTWTRVLVWIKELGADVVKATVSRVDLCVDLPGVPVDPFVRAFEDGRVISRIQRARKHLADDAGRPGSTASETIYYKKRKITGLTLLGCDSMVRVYDKAEECKDLCKRAWMIHRRWGGKDQDTAARVEFELRRDFLKAKKCKTKKNEAGEMVLNRPAIDTVQDLFDKLPDLVEYLTVDWLRFVAEGFDPNHTERAKDMEIWKRVQRDFRSWAGAERTHNLRPLRRAQVLVDALWKQVRGVCESIAARQQQHIYGRGDLVGFVTTGVDRIVATDLHIATRVSGKMNTLAQVIADDVELADDDPLTRDPDGIAPF